jgi:hypothetical protein
MVFVHSFKHNVYLHAQLDAATASPRADMTCMETLLVTILCWVAVFGVIDNLVSRLKTDAERLAAYGLVGVLAAALAWACRRVTVCSLL